MTTTRRPAPKLRTKTGCFMCRKRRKKCDEVKPVCTDCSKHSFKCVWPAPGHVHLHVREDGHRTPLIVAKRHPPNRTKVELLSTPFSDDSTKIGLARSPVYGLPGIRTSVEHHLSLCFKDKFMPTLLRANAHPAFGEYSPLFGLGADCSTLMEIFLATTAMHTSWTNPKFKTIAVKYYNSVVSSVRKAIETSAVEGDEDWLLLTTNFMCIFEIFREREITRKTGVITHLEGFARMLSIRITNDKNRIEKKHERPFNRTTSESLVYHLCTESLYDSSLDHVQDFINWDDLAIYLDYTFLEDAAPYEASPLLACDWRIYRACMQITRLSHNTPLDTADKARGLNLELDMYQFYDNLSNDAKKHLNNETALDCIHQAQLYITAAQILIFKTLRPDAGSSHPRIRQLVRNALGMIANLRITEFCCVYFCWPIAIVSCAVETEEDVRLLQRVLDRIWELSLCGEAGRVRQALNIFWNSSQIGKNEGNLELGANDDITNILLCREGLFNHPYVKSDGS
ncbi:fungal-specific transcription factor domain-containing protein [Tricladium varicosporioides]|nr:fungal-specific transcription factor domain-containing protein [Hymenoscyphus varicosporioides]